MSDSLYDAIEELEQTDLTDINSAEEYSQRPMVALLFDIYKFIGNAKFTKVFILDWIKIMYKSLEMCMVDKHAFLSVQLNELMTALLEQIFVVKQTRLSEDVEFCFDGKIKSCACEDSFHIPNPENVSFLPQSICPECMDARIIDMDKLTPILNWIFMFFGITTQCDNLKHRHIDLVLMEFIVDSVSAVFSVNNTEKTMSYTEFISTCSLQCRRVIAVSTMKMFILKIDYPDKMIKFLDECDIQFEDVVNLFDLGDISQKMDHSWLSAPISVACFSYVKDRFLNSKIYCTSARDLEKFQDSFADVFFRIKPSLVENVLVTPINFVGAKYRYCSVKLALLYRKGIIDELEGVEIHDEIFEEICEFLRKERQSEQFLERCREILAARREQFLIPTGHFTKPAIRHPVSPVGSTDLQDQPLQDQSLQIIVADAGITNESV